MFQVVQLRKEKDNILFYPKEFINLLFLVVLHVYWPHYDLWIVIYDPAGHNCDTHCTNHEDWFAQSDIYDKDLMIGRLAGCRSLFSFELQLTGKLSLFAIVVKWSFCLQ